MKKMTLNILIMAMCLIFVSASTSIAKRLKPIEPIPVDTQAPAPVPVTGVTIPIEDRWGTEADDGTLQRGVTWPRPRFTDNGDDTVTDNLTGLMWIHPSSGDYGKMTWDNALAVCTNITTAGYSDWRLPNVRELLSLVHYGHSYPAIPNTLGTGKCTEGDPFYGVDNGNAYGYWTSTAFNEPILDDTSPCYFGCDWAWYVNFSDGIADYQLLPSPYKDWKKAWCVRSDKSFDF